MNNYLPKPKDTSDVVIPAELQALGEDIARQVHEVWAAGRVSQGWKYGPVRDDASRQTPCMVPYDDLAEEERQYDRDTALATIKYILSQGFEIRKK